MRTRRWGIVLVALLATQPSCFLIRVSSNRPMAADSARGGEERDSTTKRAIEPCELASLPAPTGRRLPLAVLDFRVGEKIGSDASRALADLCRATIQDSGQFQLVDRERIAEILGEREFAGAMDCDSTSCIIRYGKLIGAQKVMHGRINELGDVYVLAIGLTDVQTSAQVSQSASLDALEQSTEAVPALVCRILQELVPDAATEHAADH